MYMLIIENLIWL